MVFFLAFGLRRLHAPLYWYGLALVASGVGALVGLILVPRARRRLAEQQILLGCNLAHRLASLGAAFWGTLGPGGPGVCGRRGRVDGPTFV